MIEINFTNAITGISRLQKRIVACQGFMDDAYDLMENWERITEEDTRQGILSGTDKDGNSAPRLHYRPVTPGGKKLTVQQRLGQHPRKRRGEYYGKGKYSWTGLLDNNNLRSSEYRQLAGPYLAPRGQFSRVISNFKTGLGTPTGHGRDPDTGEWFTTGAWVEVVTPKGDSFLHYHFNGEVPGTDHAYDLRGVRPEGVKKCIQSLRAWASLRVRGLWRGAV